MSTNLQSWINSFRLVPDASAPVCKKGQTFRGTARNASVEFGQSEIQLHKFDMAEQQNPDQLHNSIVNWQDVEKFKLELNQIK